MPITDSLQRAEYARNYYLRNKKRLNAYRRNWAATYPEKEKRYKKKWLHDNRAWFYGWEKARDPIIRHAYTKVRYALLSGKLSKQPCSVCGCKTVHAHHDDYTKPLQVEWLCPKHHKQRHNDETRKNS